MNLLRNLKILIVALALVAPGMVFIFTGAVTGFEQKEQVNFPPPASVLLPAPESREQLADAIFERSAAKRWAIQLMNAVHLYGFGFIETELAISGSDQWLFYKPQFETWDCGRHAVQQMMLNRFTLLMDLVTAAEVPLVFAVAPNKASIERDHLGGRTSRYLDCYFQFEQRFTDTVSALNSRFFVDHSKVLRHLPAERPTYLKYDTHWKREFALKAMNQLFESRPGLLGIPMYQPELQNQPAFMDILNLMLLLERESQIPVPTPLKPGFEELQSAQLASNVLIIHDSFYGRILQYLTDRSPNARFQLPLPGPDVSVRENLELADIVVVALIQRDFLSFIWSDTRFGWGGVFAEWLLDEMADSAQQCNWEGVRDLLSGRPGQRANFRNVVVTGNNDRFKGSKKSRVFFQLPHDLAPGRVCLRIQLDAMDSGRANLYFSAPGAAKNQPGYSASLMVSKNLKKGSNTLALVLPESFKGKSIRFDPVDHDSEFTIQALDITSFD